MASMKQQKSNLRVSEHRDHQDRSIVITKIGHPDHQDRAS